METRENEREVRLNALGIRRIAGMLWARVQAYLYCSSDFGARRSSRLARRWDGGLAEDATFPTSCCTPLANCFPGAANPRNTKDIRRLSDGQNSGARRRHEARFRMGDGGQWRRRYNFGFAGNSQDDAEIDYVDEVVEGVKARQAEIDEWIAKFAHGWSLERMNRVDLAILRVAVFEILAGQVPEPVAVNEAVELSKQYSTERSPAFINGVLGSIRRARR